MAGYLFLYRECSNNVDLSPQEMQAHMQKWMDWIGQGINDGWMTNPGDALKGGRTLHADKSTTDGPFAESKEIVGGYSIIEASDLDAATKLAQGCPIFDDGGCVEIRELAMVMADNPA